MTTLTTLDERLALLWLRKHQPAGWYEQGAPPSRMRTHLLRAGLIQINPNRKRFDPVTFCLTQAGQEALQ